MHTPHADSHVHGLADDCPECRGRVANPTEIDAENLRRIWEGTWHTATDRDVFNVLYRAVVLTQRLGEAFAWRDFDPTVDSITSHVPHPKPDQYALFEHGGRR